eukprot:10105-Rhodomonas_salina.1
MITCAGDWLRYLKSISGSQQATLHICCSDDRVDWYQYKQCVQASVRNQNSDTASSGGYGTRRWDP